MEEMSLVVTIERILPGGVGLAHIVGKTVFVSLAAKGDVVRITVDREQGNLFFASIAEILEPGVDRVEPPCPYFGRCGGCDFQQLTYDAQLRAKEEIIRDCLHRIAHIELAEVSVVSSPNPWHYRARATWQIDPELQTLGYYERGSRRVCDVVDCAILVPELQHTLERVRSLCSELPAGIKHLDAVVGEAGVSLSPEFANLHTNEVSLNVRNGERYNYNADAFFQVNHDLLAQLIDFALKDAEGETALDLYCGVGLFTLPLARRFKHVIGVESNPVATRFAGQNLEQAGLSNAEIVTSGVTDWIGPVKKNAKKNRASQWAGSMDFVLLDPPRAGAESAVIKGILALNPARICYVSCDPATLARDLKKLIAGGFKIEAISGFDMFPQTHHVETVVQMTR